MQIERRALYNLLRMNWLQDPFIEAEPWQIEDYREMSYKAIFDRLKEKNVNLDRPSFLALAENHDTPEDLTDELLDNMYLDIEIQDQIYLLVFELWRRLITEKPCLSIFCDELDHQIHLYDTSTSQNTEAIQDVLANFQVVLDENADQGVNPRQVFISISAGCANDIESFLYDFIAQQIDNRNDSYAAELLDGFYNYMTDEKWFDFLRARLQASTDIAGSNQLIRQIVQNTSKEPDLEFNLEILSFLVQGGEKEIFVNLVKKTIALIIVEEDLQDLLLICADFYHCLDYDHEELAIQKILKERSNNKPEETIDRKDPHFAELLKVMRDEG